MTIAIIVLSVLLAIAIVYILGLRRTVKNLYDGLQVVCDDRDRCADYILNNYIMQSADFVEKKSGVRKVNDEQRAEAKRIYDAIKAKQAQLAKEKEHAENNIGD